MTNKESKPTLVKTRRKVNSIKPEFILRNLNWLARNTPNMVISGQVNILLSYLIKYQEEVLQQNGKGEVIRMAKAMRNLIFRIVSDEFENLKDLKRVLMLSNLPRRYRSVLEDIFNKKYDYGIIRIILTIFYVSRALKLSPIVNLDTITSAYKGTEDLSSESWNKYIDSKSKNFWKKILQRESWSISPRKSLKFSSFHLTTKSGPQGHGLWTSLKDYLLLKGSLKESLKYVGGKRIEEIFSCLDNHLSSVQPFFVQEDERILLERKQAFEKEELLRQKKFEKLKKKFKSFKKEFRPKTFRIPNSCCDYPRKIVGLSAEEGKTRIVAIFDYWSQTILLPVHQYLFSILRGIPQDCTFDQGSFIRKIKRSGFCSSVDLTAFTDRFPFQFNLSLIRTRFGKTFAENWKTIMVEQPFWVPDLKVETTYKVGNPMGAYSSWNSTSLAHHFLIYLCCEDLEMDWSKAPYVLLGDDLVIQDENLNNKYLELIKTYGIDFSKEKSHINNNGVLEFAKRFIVRDTEITPFPLQAIWVNRKRPIMVFNTIIEEAVKGWFTTKSPLELYENWLEHNKYSSSFRTKKFNTLFPTHQIMMVLQGRLTPKEALKPLLDQLFPTLSNNEKLTDEACANIFKTIVMLNFEDSFRDDSKSTLGALALNLVIFITGLDHISPGDQSQIISSIPILGVQGLIEEKYLRISKEAFDIDTIYKGDWKLSLKALTIPVSDTMYYTPNKELLFRTSIKLGNTLLQQLSTLEQYPQLI